MAWTDACKLEAVAQIDKRKETSGGLRKALRELSKESEIPYGTLKRWYYPEGVPNNENTPPEPFIEKEPSAISDLHILTYDSGRRKIKFCLCENNGEWTLSMQDYRMGQRGKDVATKNRLIIPLNLYHEFRKALEVVHEVLRKEASIKSGGVGSDHKEDTAELQAGDDAGVSRSNEVDSPGPETEAPAAAADATEDTAVEAEIVQCVDCVHFAVKKGAPEENGACNSRSGSWNGPVFQPPHEPHPCPNFQDGQPG